MRLSRSTAVLAAGLGTWVCATACVETGHARPPGDASASADARPQPATCQANPADAAVADATIPSGDAATTGPYRWKNVVIKGGGFVSGIVMSPALRGLAFARTDVGGAYRFDPADQRWTAVTDGIGHATSNLVGIESVALDPLDPNRVYLAAGEYLTAGNGAILSSTDMGQTWVRHDIDAPMGGNVDGRSMGERLAIDPNSTSTLYFGSRTSGLWTSSDSGATWRSVTSFPTTGATNGGAGSGSASGQGFGLSFVLFDPATGTPGSPTPSIYVGVGVTTETALYRSTDAGVTWQALPGQPSGMMPHHAVLDGCGNVYLAYNNGGGPNNITAGAVWRYTIGSGSWSNVSPPARGGGFGGLDADVAHPGTLVVTTLDRWSPDEIYRTTDGGVTWTALGPKAVYDVAGAAWTRFHRTLQPTGWMGDVAIDPFDSSHALYTTGQGLWSSDDLAAADKGLATHWTFSDDGLEETVALDLTIPPAGPLLLSGVGDVGGFRHDDLGVSPAQGMFDNPLFVNTSSLDFAEAAPNIVARVGTNSSPHGATGAYSTDGGSTWTPFAGAPAVSGTTAANAGSIAVSADGGTFVWSPQPNRSSSPTPSYSRDRGATWTACAGLAAGAQVAADRVNPSKFYASARGAMLASVDGGATFTSKATSSSGRPRPVFGLEGDVWVVTNAGLLRSQDSGGSFAPVAGVTGATAVGFGIPLTAAQTYPSIYLAGLVGSVWGTYRSLDAGSSWQRIDDADHQFGWINCLAGDRRVAGRVYLGTSGRGIVYGDPEPATLVQGR